MLIVVRPDFEVVKEGRILWSLLRTPHPIIGSTLFQGGVNLQTQASKSLLNLMTNLEQSRFWLQICLNLNGIKRMFYTIACWSRLNLPLTTNHLELYSDGWFFHWRQVQARFWEKIGSFDRKIIRCEEQATGGLWATIDKYDIRA